MFLGIMEIPNGAEFSLTEDLEQVFESEIRLLGRMTEKEFLDVHNSHHDKTHRR